MKARKTVLVALGLTALLALFGALSSGQGSAFLRQASAQEMAVAGALGTDFTYQGQLTDQGSPANGNFDLFFALKDAPSGGSTVGTPVSLEDVPVADGFFTVHLDFGAGAFNGQARWLQIGVRPGDSVGAHDELLPWQPITISPYAQFATEAQTAQRAEFAETVYLRTIIVRPVRTPRDNGRELLRALEQATGATADNQILIKLEPGTYDVGDTPVKMKEYVDIEGSGSWSTDIVGTGAGTSDTGVVWGANNAELRFVSVRCSADGADWATAIYNLRASPSLLHVWAYASGAREASIAIRNEVALTHMRDVQATTWGGAFGAAVININSPTKMINVEATARGAALLTYAVYNEESPVMMQGVVAVAEQALDDAYGVYNKGYPSPTMINVTASAEAVDLAYGVYNESSSPVMDQVVASGDGDFASYGVYNDDSVPSMNHITASAAGAGANYGIVNVSFSAADIAHSTARASGGTYACGIFNDQSAATISNVVATGWGSTGSHYGVCNYRASPKLINVTASGEGSGTLNAAVRNYESSPNISNSTLMSSGASDNYGIYNLANSGSYSVWVNNSQIMVPNADATVRSFAGFATRIGSSFMSGGAVDTALGGTVACAGVYDEGYAAVYTGACP